MTDLGDFGSVAERGDDFGTRNDGGGWVSDLMDFTTFGQVVNALNAAGRNTIAAGGPVGTRSASIGDGYGNNVSISGVAEGANAGPNDYAGVREDMINAFLNRSPTPPTKPARVPRGGTEGGRRPSSSRMRSQYMPAYRGVRAGRYRRPIAEDQYINQDEGGQGPMFPDDIMYPGGSKWFDESTGQRRPGAPPLGPGQKGYRGNGGSQYDPSTGAESRDPMIAPPHGDGYEQMTGHSRPGFDIRSLLSSIGGISQAQEGNNALTALSSFMPRAQQAASERSGGMTDYLTKLISRGDIAPDSGSINAAASPRLQKGRNSALEAIMMGNRVPDNLYDMSNLGADIGGRQGAQNVNVRGRASPRGRRY